MDERLYPKIIIFILYPYLLSAQGAYRMDSTGYALGTQVHLVFYHDNVSKGQQILRESFGLIEDLEGILSDYQINSEVGILNQSLERKELIVSKTICDILLKSQKAHETSQGLFDCTIGEVTHLWRSASRKNKIPSDHQIKRALRSVGMEKFLLDTTNQTLTIFHPKLKFDFGGIGKGYIADCLASFLKEYKVDQYLIDLGGDVLLGQAPPEKTGWEIHLPIEAHLTESLHSMAIAASGSQWQFYQGPNYSYSHIMHPKEGKQIREDKLTVVFAEKGYWADAMATAVHLSSDLEWAEHKDFAYLQLLAQEYSTSKNINDYIHIKFDFDAH